jgi:hypothetical protein
VLVCVGCDVVGAAEVGAFVVGAKVVVAVGAADGTAVGASLATFGCNGDCGSW